ncbi:MAG: hypothetical protein H6677_21960 [Candidatus Obscuribacterales bacterium]|nr:hypothetical protein [Candidatus Obscuribacterales bacterium]
MVGLAGGALIYYLVERKSQSKINGLKLLALLETLVALAGFASLWLTSSGNIESLLNLARSMTPAQIGDYQAVYNACTTWSYGFVLLALAIPTTCMGATLPALANYCRAREKEPARSVIRLYQINALGALAGTICGGIVLLYQFGISASITIAASLNLVAGALAFLADKQDQDRDLKEEEVAVKTSEKGSFGPYLAVFFSGFVFFALESVWTRFLLVFFGSSTYALTVVLAVCLIAIIFGAWLADLISSVSKDKNRIDYLPALLALGALVTACILYLYPLTPELYLNLRLGLENGFLDMRAARVLTMLLTGLWLILLPATLISMIFPFCIGSSPEKQGFSGQVASLYALNMTGSVLGALSIHALFEGDLTHIFKSTIEAGTIIVSILLICASLVLAIQNRSRSRTLLIFLVIGGAAILLLLRPAWREAKISVGYPLITLEQLKQSKLGVSAFIDRAAGSDRLLFYREGGNAVIAVKENRKANITYLSSNGKPEAAIPIKRELPAPASDLSTHTLMGLSASIFCPNNNQENLLIGYGSGTTCGTLLSLDRVKSLKVLEIEKAVYSVDQYFQPSNLSPLRSDWVSSHRIEPISADARNYIALDYRSNHDGFDTIVSQPAEPWVSGSSNLYSKEFFELVRSRLKPGGACCQWLQLYLINKRDFEILLRTFETAFPSTYVMHGRNAGEVILIGTTEETKLDLQRIRTALDSKPTAALLSQTGIYDPAQFLARIILFPSKSTYDQVNTDDNLYSEMHLGLSPGSRATESSIENILTDLYSTSGDTIVNHCEESKKPDKFFLCRLALAMAESSRAEARPATDTDLIDNLIGGIHNYTGRARAAQINSLLSSIASTDRGLASITEARIKQIKGDKNVENLPAPASTKSSLENALYARYQYERGRKDQAVEAALSACATSGDDWYSLLTAGKVLLFCGKYDAAVTTFKKAASLRDNHPEILSALCLSEALSGKDSLDTDRMLEKSLKLDPAQYLARYALARNLLARGDFDRSLSQIYYASKVSGSDPGPQLFATACFVKIHHWKNASINFERLKQKMSDGPLIEALERLIKERKTSEENENLIERILQAPLPVYGS